MSRNLGTTSCAFCWGKVMQDEPVRRVTREDCGVYFKDNEGMLVFRAKCVDCEATYLAWADRSACKDQWGSCEDRPFFDLSHFSTFNDEPGPKDMPRFAVTKRTVVDRAPWPKCYTCDGPMDGYSRERCMDRECASRKAAT